MTPRWLADDAPLRLGVSACLLGREVRHDGGHKRDRFLTDVLGSHVEWVAVCPEVEIGMSIPRPSIRLVRSADELRLIEPRTGTDHTRAMEAWSARRAHALAALDLCGYVLKKDSPSCGMERVKVWRERGQATRDGRGLFASALISRFGALPVEEEGRLNDPVLRENFIERIFAFRRLRALFRPRWTLGDLVGFHTAHKLQLLAHSELDYRRLGRWVAQAKKLPRAEVRATYEQDFMAALTKLATAKRHTNVLQHMVGYLRRGLDSADRAELAALIEDFRRELVPIVVPLALLRHHVRRLDVAYLRDQIYLDPHPKELMLRNHV